MNIENAVNHMINIQTELLNRDSDLNYINQYNNKYSYRQYTNTLLNLELDNNQYSRYYYDISSILESINTLSNHIDTIFLTSLNNTDTVDNNTDTIDSNLSIENTYEITDDMFYNTSTYNYLLTHYYNYRNNNINRRYGVQFNTVPINNTSNNTLNTELNNTLNSTLNNTLINKQINLNNKLYFDKIRHLKKEKCNICYGSKKLFTKIKKCNHDFCNGCLKQWITLNTTCPICRAHIISNNI